MTAKLDIKRAMKSRGVKLTELSEALGVKPQTIITYYNGNPNVGTLYKIAEALKCDIRDLFFDDTTPYYVNTSIMHIGESADEEEQSNMEKFDGFHSVLQAAEERPSIGTMLNRLPPDHDKTPVVASAITPSSPIQCPHCGKILHIFHNIQTKLVK